MKTNRKKVTVAVTAISGVLLAGGATIAAANPGSDGASSTGTSVTTGSSGTTNDDATESEGDESDEVQITGTITAPEELPDDQEAPDGSAEEKTQEEAETAALAALATVTEDQARAAATDAVPGTITEIELDEKNGFVVWEAVVTQEDGTTVEVLIDAGDGSVLAKEAADDDDASGHDEADGDHESSDEGSQAAEGQEITTNR